ncbi:MAG: hypothetical protein P8H35_01510 [Flavobacteriales bacterium]|nr:hypothetical protein [Flavobacteriales bacterium]
MKHWVIIISIFTFGSFYSKNDSILIPVVWNQLSLLPDSNNYNLLFGGPGSIYRSLSFNQNQSSIFDEHFLFSKEQLDMPLLISPIALVDAQYIIGDELEQNLSLYHNQSISSHSNYAVSFLKRSHEGYYTNQSTNHNFFQFHYYNQKSDSSYSVFTGMKHHRIYNQQNGGLIEDTSFINNDNTISNRKILNVNMNQSYSNEKFWKFFINQKWSLGKGEKDTINNAISKVIIFNTSIQKKSRTYFDSLNSNLFVNNFNTEFSTNDTFSIDLLSNTISYNLNYNKNSISRVLNLSLVSDFFSQKNLAIDTLLNNQSIKLNYFVTKNKNSLSLKSQYYFHGFKKSNYSFNLNFNKEFFNGITFNITGFLNEYTPVFEINNFDSNHHFWNNIQYNKVFSSNIISSFTFKNYALKTEYHNIENPIFFKDFGRPSQSKASSQIIKTSLSNLTINKKFSLFSEIVYQYQGGDQIFQLPSWIGQLKFNYIILDKKNNLRIEAGINARAFSSYYLPSYFPEINQFGIQNSFLQNEYFIVDFLMKSTIKEVVVFAMLTHLNAGLMGNNYFSSYHYPSPDRCFKFGLKWLFLN